MSVRVAVGDPRAITVEFPNVASGNVNVSVISERNSTTLGPFVASNLGDGLYSYSLLDSMVSAVDKLQLVFTGTIGGVNYTRKEWVEVAGVHYFTVSEARLHGPIDSSFSDEDIERQRMSVEDQIEANCDTFFVARYVDESVSGRGQFLRLTENYVLNLIKAYEDGVDITSQVKLDGRYVWRGNYADWAPGFRNVNFKYEAGWDDHPPGDLRRKAIEATRYTLLRERRQGLPPQAVTIGTDAGTLRLAVAGLKQPFGLPEVDAVVLKWARRTAVPVAGT